VEIEKKEIQIWEELHKGEMKLEDAVDKLTQERDSGVHLST
jgi:hypothetical protein